MNSPRSIANAQLTPPTAQLPALHDLQPSSPSSRQPSAWTTIQPAAYLLLALLLPLFAVAPLLYPGYIQTHSGFVTLWNVADLRANLGHLAWLPHVALTFDPVRGDGLLFYYLAALLPLSPPVAIKLVAGLAWFLGSLGMAAWLRRSLGAAGAVVAALVYTYLPFHIAVVYVRGAWGEALFWGLLPWALLALEAGRERPSRSTLLAALVWLALGLSQLGLSLWGLEFGLAWLGTAGRFRSLPAGLAALAGVGLAGLVSLSLAAPIAPVTTFADHFLYPFQLFSAAWGFGPGRPGWNDSLSFQLGLAALGLAVLSLSLWPRWKTIGSGSAAFRPAFLVVAALLLSLLQFSPANLLWRLPLPGLTSLAGTLTYPWQLLGLAGLCLAVLAGSALRLERSLAELPVFGAIIIFVILSSYGYLQPQFVHLAQPLAAGPEALVGDNQLALLDHAFTVSINGDTAGLERGTTTLPLAVHGPLQPGQTLMLNVTWQPLRPFEQDFKIFVHLVDAQGRVLAQFDGQPQAGAYPTSAWLPGETIPDAYPLLLPAAAGPGPYRVFLGLYDEASLARLPVPGDAEGRIVLDVR